MINTVYILPEVIVTKYAYEAFSKSTKIQKKRNDTLKSVLCVTKLKFYSENYETCGLVNSPFKFSSQFKEQVDEQKDEEMKTNRFGKYFGN